MSARQVRSPVKIRLKGTIQPPRGTPGANGAFLVDLEMEIPVQGFVEWFEGLKLLIRPR
ncbi:MAG: hypothetical protein KAI25_09685 [Hyphomicrobiaceae bacterium]|nr:hypothetical protein [Hyphomicrobiaceae bacterium]